MTAPTAETATSPLPAEPATTSQEMVVIDRVVGAFSSAMVREAEAGERRAMYESESTKLQLELSDRHEHRLHRERLVLGSLALIVGGVLVALLVATGYVREAMELAIGTGLFGGGFAAGRSRKAQTPNG